MFDAYIMAVASRSWILHAGLAADMLCSSIAAVLSIALSQTVCVLYIFSSVGVAPKQFDYTPTRRFGCMSAAHLHAWHRVDTNCPAGQSVTIERDRAEEAVGAVEDQRISAAIHTFELR